jgi:hypothetical protein
MGANGPQLLGATGHMRNKKKNKKGQGRRPQDEAHVFSPPWGWGWGDVRFFLCLFLFLFLFLFL